MARVVRCGGRRRSAIWWLAAACLFPIEIPFVLPASVPMGQAIAQEDPGQDPGGLMPDDMDGMPRPTRARSRTARKKARPVEKAVANKKADTRSRAKAADAGGLSFAQDIAPILVANCNGCHSKDGVGVKRGKLDLSTFENLQKGAADHKVIEPGKPDDSHLVLRINGGEDPKMPQGGNRDLSADAIAKITQWVKEGARLDAGLDPKAAIDSYAASPEQVRRRQLAKTPQKDRDQKVIEVGQARWKQSNSKQKLEVTPGRNFILFSTFPAERASSTLKTMEAQHGYLRQLLGPSATEWPEKVSLYVFNDHGEFVEFVRTVEQREPESEENSSTRLNVAQPYVAAVDPLGGKKETPAPRHRAKGKRGEEAEPGGSDRTLLGRLTEGVATGAVGAAGNAPRWLRDGIGLYMAERVEPRSPYYRELRQFALRNVQQGWQTRASYALGGSDQITAEEQRAIGFALVECIMSTQFRQDFPEFLHGMLQNGQGALDDMIRTVYNGTREQFLAVTEEWILQNYGR